MIALEIDTPPSVNSMYGNRAKGRGRYLKPKARQWRNRAAWEIKTQIGRDKIEDFPVRVMISLPPDCRGDEDNRIKGCLDLLVVAGVLPDDGPAYVRGPGVTATRTAKPGRCIVTIAKWDAE